MALKGVISSSGGGGGSGTVTSVAVSGSNGIGVSGSPVTSSGTITLSLGNITPTTVNGATISTTTGGTLTLADSSTLATSGANSVTLTSTGATNVTLPTTGTLATLAGTENLSNKSFTTAVTITSSSANSLIVGPNGTTNPVLQVDGSTASQVTGISITGNSSGQGAAVGVVSSNASEGLVLASKGTGNITLRINASNRCTFSTVGWSLTPTTSSTANVRFNYTGASNTGLTAGTEFPQTHFNMGQTNQHTSNTAITTQRDFLITPMNDSFATAGGVITNKYSLYVESATAGTNASYTNNYSLGAAGNASISGYTLTQRRVAAKTEGVGAPYAAAASESFTAYTNEGATAQTYITLPTAAAGLVFSAYCQDSDGIRVVANTGDTIRINTTVSGSAGYAESTAIGSSATFLAINATEWVALCSVGTWSVV